MRPRVRPQVLVPAALLVVAVLGLAAFVFTGKKPAVEPVSDVQPAAVQPEETQAAPAKKTPLERALRKKGVVVVVLYSPDAAVDSLATREARAGALAAGAGFLAVDVSDDEAAADFATTFDARQAPVLLVFKRGPEMVTRIDGYADRDTVAQAAGTAKL